MITFVGTNGQFAFNRAVPLGFHFPHNGSLSFVSLDSSELVVAQLAFAAYYHFVFNNEFMSSHTNWYTLDHVFDYPASYLVYPGTPFTPAVSSRFEYQPGENSPRITIDFGIGVSAAFDVNIPAASSPWYVRP